MSAVLQRDDNLVQLRMPPHSIEAEQSVLGGLMLDNAAFDRIVDVITEKDFYRDDHRRIWRHLVRLLERNRGADMVTVHESIKESEDRDKTGGLSYLGSLVQSTPSAHNIKRYAEIVAEKSLQRQIVTLATELADHMLRPGNLDARESLRAFEAQLSVLSVRGGGQARSIRDVLTHVMERIDHLYHQESNDGVTGLRTGLVDLDQYTTGFQPGDLILVAGRPSMGKTALAMNIGEHTAVTLGQPCLVFSLEMSDAQLVTRMLASQGHIDQQKLRTGKLTDDDWHKLTGAVGKLHAAPLIIEETTSLTISELRAKARRAFREYGRLGLIIVDYIGLMAASGDTRAQALGDVSRGLKALAKELNVPVLALSQLNRDIEKRVNRRPMLSDLRDSGSLEQDADVILFLHREDGDSWEPGMTELIIGKQRNGPTESVKLTFFKEWTRFENYASTGWTPPARSKRRSSGDGFDFKKQSAGDREDRPE